MKRVIQEGVMPENSSSFLNHLSVYLIGVILINAAGFVLLPVYTRYLPTSEFGILEIINRCIEVSNIIFVAGLGITSLSFYCSEKEQERKDSVISTAIIALLVFSLTGASIFQVLARTLNDYFFSSREHLLLFRMASIILFAEMLSIVPMAYIRAQMKSKLFVLISTIRFVSIICINIFFVVILKMRIEGVILGNMIGSIVFATILLAYTIPRTGMKFDMPLFKKMLAFGLPFIPGGIFLFILNNGDRFFIQNMLDSSTLGIYSLGYKIGTLVMVFILGPFLKIWGPYMFKLDKDCEDRKSFGKYFLYLILAYCMAALPLAMFSKEIVRLLSGESYWEGYRVVPYVLVAYLFWATSTFFDSGFYIMRKTFYKPFIMGMATALAIALYWVMIPKYGLLGGAYATLMCFTAFSLMTYAVSKRIYPLKYPLGKFGCILSLGVAIYVLGDLMPEENGLLNLGLRTILVLLYPVIIVMTGIIDGEVMNEIKIYLGLIRRSVFTERAAENE
jgi:O-antigen/teichoic acid export membrane protein